MSDSDSDNMTVCTEFDEDFQKRVAEEDRIALKAERAAKIKQDAQNLDAAMKELQDLHNETYSLSNKAAYSTKSAVSKIGRPAWDTQMETTLKTLDMAKSQLFTLMDEVGSSKAEQEALAAIGKRGVEAETKIKVEKTE